MRWIGEYIQSLTARFRASIYLEGISSGTPQNFISIDADRQVVTGIPTIETTYGGTGLTSYTQGDILYYNTGSSLSKLGIGTAGQVLKVNSGATAPEWGTDAAGLSFNGSTSNGILTYGNSTTADVEANLTFDGTDLLFDSTGGLGSYGSNVLHLKNTNANIGGPGIRFQKLGKTGADGDLIGQINFQGLNDADELTTFAQIQAKVGDASDGAESGQLVLFQASLVASNGVTGDLTGNASTATALETARTIGGVSFNGTANIDLPGVNTAGNQNTSGTAAGLSSTLAVGSGGTGATTFTSGQILRGNGTSALTADNNLKFDGNTFAVISSTSARPQLLISNTNSDAEAPSLVFDRTSTTGADGDDIGVIRFDAEDAVGNGPHTYAQILGEIQEADDGSEEGKLTLSVASHDAESQPGLILVSGNAEDEVDVTVGNGATSITTVAGTLTMGSTATIDNSGAWVGGVIPSAKLDADTAHLTTTQTFTGAKTFEEKVTLDGDKNITPGDDGVALHVDSGNITDTNTSASGTVNSFFYTTIENPKLLATNSSVTTTTAATLHVKGAPVAHTNQTITNAYSLYVGGGTSYFNGDVSVSDLTVRGNDIKDDDGTTCITFDSSGNTSIAGTLAVADIDVTSTAGQSLTITAGAYDNPVKIVGGDSKVFTAYSDNSTAGTNTIGVGALGDDSYFRNDEGSFKFYVANDATSALTLDQSGNLNVTGIITGKQRQIYQQSFIDDLGTAKHYLPWRDTDEQTTIYQEEAAMIAPYDGRIVSVTMRMSSVAYTGTRTIQIHTFGPNASQFTTGNWTMEEEEENAISNADDNHVFYFVFDNAKHFESGELVVLSIQDDTDLHSGSRYCYVSTVVEWDYNNGLGTGSSSAEYDSAQ
tara:strand:+ start:5646 stop:8291 length:2646 start_codon:yes stop_codon:yes gene_type:complete